MAKERINMEAKSAIVLEDDADTRVDATGEGNKKPDPDATLVGWVVERTNRWREHRDAYYFADWERYERLWRGIWSSSEQLRKSERSKFVSPALSEAVEVNISEIEEAIFGRGDFFDFQPELMDDPVAREALEKNKITLKQDLANSDYVTNVSECLINAGVYGTGIGEIITETSVRREIIPVQSAEGNVTASVKEIDVEYSCLRAVNPRNFLIDPNARNIQDALGVAVEENVGLHIIGALQRSGSLEKDAEVEPGTIVPNLEADPQKEQKTSTDDTAHIIRYYGLVPKKLLFPKEKVENLFPEEENEEADDDDEMIEAIVVIANKDTLLKAAETPVLMKDRPVVAFQWDSVPGRFWGRGVCEKGEMPQRLLDAELRSRMDALAFTGAPVMGIDASRMPRGFKFEISPGKSILTAGDPNAALKPLSFGQLDANTFQQGTMLDQMVQRATGAINTTQLAQAGASGDARSGAVSMSLSGVVKRSKRTLMRFVDQFFVPSLKKILWRQMQFAPDRYTPINSTFVATSTMGIMQREYEMSSMTQLLQAVPQGSPAQAAMLKGIVLNTGLTNRTEVAQLLDQAQTPPLDPNATPPVDPAMQQLAQAKAMLELETLRYQIEEMKAKTAALQTQAALNIAKAQDIPAQTSLEARSIALKGIYEVPAEQQAAEFQNRLQAAELIDKEAERASNERIVAMQTQGGVEQAKIQGSASVVSTAIKQNAPASEVAPVVQ